MGDHAARVPVLSAHEVEVEGDDPGLWPLGGVVHDVRTVDFDATDDNIRGEPLLCWRARVSEKDDLTMIASER